MYVFFVSDFGMLSSSHMQNKLKFKYGVGKACCKSMVAKICYNYKPVFKTGHPALGLFTTYTG